MINKYYIKERYLYDQEKDILHDLKSSSNTENRDCGLENISRPLLFDCSSTPEPGKAIKIKTPGGKRKINIKNHCPACLSGGRELP